jgi:hypothetical protein
LYLYGALGTVGGRLPCLHLHAATPSVTADDNRCES